MTSYFRPRATWRPVSSPTLALAIIAAAATTIWAAAPVMTLTFGIPTVVCTNSGGSVSASYTIATTAGDAAAVTETLRLNNTDVLSNSFTIASGNVVNGGGWNFAGRATKTFDGTFTASNLANGEYTLEVCAVQNGANGNPGKSICQSETVVISCGAADSACSSRPFGEIVGNPELKQQAPVQINFKGDFGDSALLTISGPNGGGVEPASINRDGNSCNYHANWKLSTPYKGGDIYGNDGPGVYVFTVTGNGNVLTFTAAIN